MKSVDLFTGVLTLLIVRSSFVESSVPETWRQPSALVSRSSSCEPLLLFDDDKIDNAIGSRGGGATATTASAKDELIQRLRVGFYFALWYALNIVYNSK